MSGDLELVLKVGATLRMEGPDGSVAAFTVKQIYMSNGVTPDWATTTPLSGRVTLTLRASDRPDAPRVPQGGEGRAS